MVRIVILKIGLLSGFVDWTGGQWVQGQGRIVAGAGWGAREKTRKNAQKHTFLRSRGGSGPLARCAPQATFKNRTSYAILEVKFYERA